MKGTILFVEDEPYYKTIYGTALVNAGATVTYAKNGKEALELFKKHKPDLIITDLIMPEMSGMKFLNELNKKNTPIIVLTALEGETDKQDAIDAGAAYFCSKMDTNPEALIAMTEQFLGKK